MLVVLRILPEMKFFFSFHASFMFPVCFEVCWQLQNLLIKTQLCTSRKNPYLPHRREQNLLIETQLCTSRKNPYLPHRREFSKTLWPPGNCNYSINFCTFLWIFGLSHRNLPPPCQEVLIPSVGRGEWIVSGTACYVKINENSKVSVHCQS